MLFVSVYKRKKKYIDRIGRYLKMEGIELKGGGVELEMIETKQ